jgi:high-affinity Fe2+/Pb2+ permease
VLHIFVVAILYSLPSADEAKRNRWLTGMVISGLIIIAISGYLRRLSLQ